MAKTDYVELANGVRIPILFEDRSVLAMDKPPGWMLVPFSWQKTQLNLQAAVTSSIAEGSFWARCRNLKFLRHVHRLDAETSGVLLWAKSLGALDRYSDLFESRQMHKVYLAVVVGVPKTGKWTCRLKLSPNPRKIGAMRVDPVKGKEAETRFRLMASRVVAGAGVVSLVEAIPITGRTHQIRVHLAESGHPVLLDPLYGNESGRRGGKREGIGLRAIRLSYRDPFRKRPVDICAPAEAFLGKYGFQDGDYSASDGG